ncbi:conserved exported hypothetical protein [Burkholderia latens]
MKKLLACLSVIGLAACANHAPILTRAQLAEPLPQTDWLRCDIAFDYAGQAFQSRYAQLVGIPVADTPARQERGLAGPLSAGVPVMLFTWSYDQPRPMWMKDMAVPLSVAFLDNEGNVTQIEPMQAGTTALHWSTYPARAALVASPEVFPKLGIHVGSRMQAQQCSGPVVYPPLRVQGDGNPAASSAASIEGQS